MVLKDFHQRLEHYIKFQRGIEKDIGAKQKPVADPQVINRKQETLAARFARIAGTPSRETSSLRRSRTNSVAC
jgi:hypothetical protein